MKHAKSKNIYSANKDHINRYKIAHMIGVAEYMRKRAENYHLNADIAYTVGLLHDIGYLKGRIGHEEYGAELLSIIGANKDFIDAIKYHGSNPYEHRDCINPWFALLLEADMSIDVCGFCVGFQGRIEDIETRYGVEHDASRQALKNITFIEEYLEEHDIPFPDVPKKK